jgi:hypothetical protein
MISLSLNGSVPPLTGTPDDLKTQTPPTACALAVALPLSRDAFMSDVAAYPEMEYSRGMLRGRPAELVWQNAGAAIARQCREVMTLAERLNVEVLAEAKLSDLGPLFARRQVVTVLAHWRGAMLRADDIVAAPSEIVATIRSAQTPVMSKLVKRIPHTTFDAISSAEEDEARTTLVEALNSIIDSDQPLLPLVDESAGVAVVSDSPTVAAWNRDLLDEAFGSALRPANRIELRDGLRSASDITAQIPDGFRGIIDLALCQSMIVARAIAAGQTRRRVIMHRRVVQPRVRLALLEQVYRLLAGGNRNYATTLFELYKALADWSKTNCSSRDSSI